jgi:serine/threonine protein kinase HipA of HipAB toxin-antitoxin module
LRATQSLGWTEIEVNVMQPIDTEAALNIEIGENEEREPFTFSEQMAYAKLIDAIEQVKALERKSAGGREAGRGRPGTNEKDVPNEAHPIDEGRTRKKSQRSSALAQQPMIAQNMSKLTLHQMLSSKSIKENDLFVEYARSPVQRHTLVDARSPFVGIKIINFGPAFFFVSTWAGDP